MTIEIHKPELARRVQAQIQSGHFHNADELIEKALNALDEQTNTIAPAAVTGAVVLAALQASPYQDVDLTPPRVRLSNVRDVVL
jgi:Arc/MetJ-type ribon-helix-helix transcriptional regulator